MQRRAHHGHRSTDPSQPSERHQVDRTQHCGWQAASSQNAVRHGGYSSRALAIQTGAFKEDPDEISDYIDSIVEALKPRDALEHEEARRIATASLRFRRVSQLEAHAMSRVENEPAPLHAQSHHILDGYDSAEHAEQIQNEKIRINLSLQLLESVIAKASRIDADNSRQLDQAMKRYAMLQYRDLDDPSETPEHAAAKPIDRAQFKIAT